MSGPPTGAVLNGIQPVLEPGGATCVLQTSRTSVHQVCEACTLVVDITSGSFDLSFFQNNQVVPNWTGRDQIAQNPAECLGGDRSGLTTEGPFLLYTVSGGALDVSGPDMPVQTGTRTRPLQYLFDASQRRPIFLPYTGQVEIITQYPGRWFYSTYIQKYARQTQVQSMIEAELTLSLKVAQGSGSNSFRNIPTPPLGSHSFSCVDSGGQPSVTVGQETTPQTVTFRTNAGAGASIEVTTDITPTDVNNIGGAFYTRSHLQNGQSFTAQMAGNTDGFMTFHLAVK